jgi:xenotropic and polytropic retrovirus receptor 1
VQAAEREAREEEEDEAEEVAPESDFVPRRKDGHGVKQPPSSTLAPPASGVLERQPLVGRNRPDVPSLTRYGSIFGSPPGGPSTAFANSPPSLRLPAPAISSEGRTRKTKKKVTIKDRKDSLGSSAYDTGRARSAPDVTHPRGSIFHSRAFARSPLRKLLSISYRDHSPGSTPDIHMDVYRELESAQNDFFGYLDDELDKIESFYKEREDEATGKLRVLRDQLHILRDRRLEDLIKSRREGFKGKRDSSLSQFADEGDAYPFPKASWLGFVKNTWNNAINGKVGRKSVAMEAEGTPEAYRPLDNRRDYVRRKTENDIPYRSAKRKLKQAFQEYYRSLELLKSYAILNRTGFRKIVKKYDKATNAKPTGRYMSEKVNKAWFVKSDVVDDHIKTVEDLYARYFEAGNHKIAANKLRKTTTVKTYYGDAMFRNGIFLGAGSVFGAFGIEASYYLLHSSDREIATLTSYLNQVCINMAQFGSKNY